MYSVEYLLEQVGASRSLLRELDRRALVRPKLSDLALCYSEQDKIRVELALKAQDLGFTLDDLEIILSYWE